MELRQTVGYGRFSAAAELDIQGVSKRALQL
jgi:hypothetical protein